MKIPGLGLGPRLSFVSWVSIELFFSIAVFCLPFSKSLAEIGLTVSLVLWLLRKFPYGEEFPRLKGVGIAYLLFLLFTALSLLQVSPAELATGGRGFLKWLKYVTTFFMGLEFFSDPSRRQRFLRIFMTSLGLACLNGYFQAFTGSDLVKNYSIDDAARVIRMKSSFPSANSLGAFLLFGLPLALSGWSGAKKFSFRYFAGAFLLVFFGVAFILTFSRGAFFSLALAVFFYFLFFRARSLWKLILGVTVILAAFTLSPLLNSTFFGNLSLNDITIGERLRYWQVAWSMIREHPFLGNGVNMFYEKFSAFAPLSERYRGYAHNCYLQLWSEIGLFGLLAFLWPVVKVLFVGTPWKIKSSENFPLEHALWTGALAFLIQSGQDTHFYSFQTAVIFWALWGLVALSLKSPAATPLQNRKI